MGLDISLKLKSVDSVSIGRILAGFEDEKGQMQDGRIKVDGQIYEVKFLNGSTSEVRRNYQGIFGWFRNRYCHKDTTRALALQAKIDSVLAQSGTDEYRIISGTHRQFLGLLKASSQRTIEVGDYGFATNRTLVAESGLVTAMNEKLKAEGRAIKFNMIDDYNRLLGIIPEAIDPRVLPRTLDVLSSGTFNVRVPAECRDRFVPSDLGQWKAFLANPKNFDKINIPGKLYGYMHPKPGHQPAKDTGWEAFFARDKTAAMRAFVRKNLSFEHRGFKSEIINLLAEKLTRYVEICAIKDKAERSRQLEAFFARANWLVPEHKAMYEELVATQGREYADSALAQKPIEGRVLFKSFSDVLICAFFRQTSKLGLDFFRDKGTPVMFQFSDYFGRSYIGREGEVSPHKAWRGGDETMRAYHREGGVAITSSEMRHVIKMGDKSTVIRV